MENDRNTDKMDERRESGEPGGGAGRVEDVSGSPVYPLSAAPENARGELKTLGEWGQGDRGIEGYNDSGTSELSMVNGVEVGGWTEEDEEEVEAHQGSGTGG